MDAAAEELRDAALAGDVERVRRLLAAAPDPAALVADADDGGRNALYYAIGGHVADSEIVSVLTAVCPAAAADRSTWGVTPFHFAARRGQVDVVRLLLAACPSAALVRAMGTFSSYTALHFAGADGDEQVVQLLLEADPASAAVEASGGDTALDLCCQAHPRRDRHCRTARLLIAAPGQQPARLLRSLWRALHMPLPLFAIIVASYPLTSADWQLVPFSSPDLAAALPTVLERSAAEAALLVARLPDAERCRLHTAALALHRAQAVAGLALLQPLLWRILATAMA